MKQFDLKEYLANPSKKVVTRDGRNARIICTDRRDLNFPIVTLIERKLGEGEVIYAHTKDGIYCNTCPTTYDLFFAPERHEGWISIHRGSISGYYTDGIFDSEEKAKERGGSIATVKVEWEE